MKTIVVIGAPNTGKTSVIYETVKWLWKQDPSFERKDVLSDPEYFAEIKSGAKAPDLRTVFDVKGTKVFFCSATDDVPCIERLNKCLLDLDKKNYFPDILVTSCRRFDDPVPHDKMLQEMRWESKGFEIFDSKGQRMIQIPTLAVKHEGAKSDVIAWYNVLIANQLIHLLGSLLSLED